MVTLCNAINIFLVHTTSALTKITLISGRLTWVLSLGAEDCLFTAAWKGAGLLGIPVVGLTGT